MKFSILAAGVLLAHALSSQLGAQCAPPIQTLGPDIIVGDLTDVNNYGTSGGYAGYSVGTESCNLGTQPCQWVSFNNNHPVIGQNLYRVKDGKFEQLGVSWLKHGFFALSLSLCCTCIGTSGSTLGVGCSDPYGAGLNGDQPNLGARSEVNATTGVFPYPPLLTPSIPAITGRRVRVPVADVTPAMNVGARYFVEGQYVSRDDALAGNGLNNASWREVTVGAGSALTLVGTTHRTEPAILAWPVVDPAVQVVTHDVPGDGRFYIGFNAFPAGGGLTRYVYAVHNLNSDRAGAGLHVGLPTGAVVQNLSFRDPDFHSGETWMNTDWIGSTAANGVSWTSPHTFATTPNGAAIRWGSTYTFSFDSDREPGAITIDLFKPGAIGSFVLPAFNVPTPQWQINTSSASLTVNGGTNNAYTGPIVTSGNPGSTLNITLASDRVGRPWDVAVQLAPGVSADEQGYTLGGQIVNLDPSVPTEFWFSGFQANATAAPWVTAIFAQPIAGTVVGQMFVLDPAASAGFFASAANRVILSGCYPHTATHTLSDDGSVLVTVGPNGEHDCVSAVRFDTVLYTEFWLNANGSVTFNGPDADFSPSVAEFLAGGPRIAGCWTDLDPASGGTITTTSNLAGGLAVNFTNVPEASTGNPTSFQLNLGSTFAVTLDFYNPSVSHSSDTLVGFHPGGAAAATGTSFSPGVTTFPAHQGVYEFVSGGAPTGFTRVTYIATATITAVSVN